MNAKTILGILSAAVAVIDIAIEIIKATSENK